MVWVIVTVCAALAACIFFLVRASASIQHSPYLKAFCCKRDGARKAVCLTFDDGVSGAMTEKVLDTLERYNVRATFFLIGQNVCNDPETVSKIVEKGHLTGSHSWSHDWRNYFRGSRVHSEEIRKSREALQSVTGLNPLYYRPPIGITTPLLGKAVRESGVSVIGWDIRSFDTMQMFSRERIARRVLRKARAGSVILLHDRCRDADKLTEMIITGLRAKGYEFTTPDKLSGTKAYE